jgi:hypothetical protein
MAYHFKLHISKDDVCPFVERIFRVAALCGVHFDCACELDLYQLPREITPYADLYSSESFINAFGVGTQVPVLQVLNEIRQAVLTLFDSVQIETFFVYCKLLGEDEAVLKMQRLHNEAQNEVIHALSVNNPDFPEALEAQNEDQKKQYLAAFKPVFGEKAKAWKKAIPQEARGLQFSALDTDFTNELAGQAMGLYYQFAVTTEPCLQSFLEDQITHFIKTIEPLLKPIETGDAGLHTTIRPIALNESYLACFMSRLVLLMDDANLTVDTSQIKQWLSEINKQTHITEKPAQNTRAKINIFQSELRAFYRDHYGEQTDYTASLLEKFPTLQEVEDWGNKNKMPMLSQPHLQQYAMLAQKTVGCSRNTVTEPTMVVPTLKSHNGSSPK